MNNEKTYKGKALYNPAGAAAEYGKWACNFYKGCSNGCTYCYLKRGITAKQLGGDRPVLKQCFRDEKHAYEVFQRELIKNLPALREHGLFFSFTTDPMLPETKSLTFKAIELCTLNHVKPTILTKCTEWIKSFPFHYYENIENEVAFGFTLTGHDELEPRASSTKKRINAMKKLHEKGFKVWVSLEPLVTFKDALNMIEQTADFCDHYKIGLESGKGKYLAAGFNEFVGRVSGHLMFLKHKPTVYLKESFLKAGNVNTTILPDLFVNREFNIFEQKNS